LNIIISFLIPELCS